MLHNWEATITINFLISESLVKARRGLFHHGDFSHFEPLLLPLHVMADVSPISDARAVPPAESRRNDTRCTCKASRPCGVWCDSEALKTVKKTSCSTCTGTVFPVCVCACASASCCASWSLVYKACILVSLVQHCFWHALCCICKLGLLKNKNKKRKTLAYNSLSQ